MSWWHTLRELRFWHHSATRWNPMVYIYINPWCSHDIPTFADGIPIFSWFHKPSRPQNSLWAPGPPWLVQTARVAPSVDRKCRDRCATGAPSDTVRGDRGFLLLEKISQISSNHGAIFIYLQNWANFRVNVGIITIPYMVRIWVWTYVNGKILMGSIPIWVVNITIYHHKWEVS